MLKPNALRLVVLGALAGAVTIGSAVLYGRISNRWGIDSRLQAASQRLDSFPERIGPWRVAEEKSLDDNAARILECQGYVYRRYVHESTGDSVTLAILLGPAGPMSVHDPEICYASRMYVAAEGRSQVLIDANGAKQAFWLATLRSKEVAGREIRVYFSWHDGARWRAPARPRFAFLGSPYLYKMQLIATAPAKSTASADAGRRFLDDAVMLMNEQLASR